MKEAKNNRSEFNVEVWKELCACHSVAVDESKRVRHWLSAWDISERKADKVRSMLYYMFRLGQRVGYLASKLGYSSDNPGYSYEKFRDECEKRGEL